MTLGEVLIAYRKENKLSQRQLGDMCGLSYAYISLIEKGTKNGKKINPSAEAIIKLAAGMGLETSELLHKSEMIPDENTSMISAQDLLFSGVCQMGSVLTPSVRRQLFELFNKLNTKGLKRAMLIVEDLTKVPEYQKNNEVRVQTLEDVLSEMPQKFKQKSKEDSE